MKIRIKETGGVYIIQTRHFFVWFSYKECLDTIYDFWYQDWTTNDFDVAMVKALQIKHRREVSKKKPKSKIVWESK